MSGLSHELRISTDIPCEEGVVLAVEILTDKAQYNTLELTSGRMAKLARGNVVVGALGHRKALFGYSGHLPEKLAGSRLYADNKTLGSRLAVHAEINDMMKRTFGKVPDRWLFNYAHADVERRVDRVAAPRRFVLNLLVSTAGAAWRWNGSISPDARTTLATFARSMLQRG